MLFPTKEGEVWQVLDPREIEVFHGAILEMAREFCKKAPWMDVKDPEDLVTFMKWAVQEPGGYAIWLAGEIDSDTLIGFCTMSIDLQLVGAERQVTVHTCYMDQSKPHGLLVEKLVEIAKEWGKQNEASEVHMASSPAAYEQWAKRLGFEPESVNYKLSI